jgi:hypothetical protein
MSPKSSPRVIWQPQPGPQTLLLQCPINDIFFGGARGGGKSDAMLGDWLQHQALYGADAKGVWFRRSKPETEEAQARMTAIFPQLGAVFAVQPATWTFPNGATLKLRYLERDQDATRYQGHAYTWIGLDELPTWKGAAPVDMLRATMRSAAGVPCRMVATGNPGGVGHDWVKARYIDPSPPLTPFVGTDGQMRVFIPSKLSDNKILTTADPTYVDKLRASGPEWLVRAWLDGDWDAALEGTLVQAEWLEHFYPTIPEQHKGNPGRIVVSVDPAEDDKACNDPTGIVVALHLDATTYLLWAEEVRLDFLALQRHLQALGDKWNPHAFVIEKKSVGAPLALQIRTRPGWRWPTLAIDPGRLSKSQRLWEQTPAMQAGQVRWPKAMPTWARDLRRELLIFPGGPDHRTDALSQLLRYFHKGSGIAGLLAA